MKDIKSVIKSFAEEWQTDIEDITVSFESDFKRTVINIRTANKEGIQFIVKELPEGLQYIDVKAIPGSIEYVISYSFGGVDI